MSDKYMNTTEAMLASTDRPLDALLPELGEQRNTVPPAQAVHQRILEMSFDNVSERVMAVWTFPGDAETLHQQVGRLIEASLLADLSRPPAAGEEVLSPTYQSYRLIIFPQLGDIGKALRAYGFEEDLERGDAYKERLAALRGEAELNGWAVPEIAASAWRATVARPQGRRGEKLVELQNMMIERMGDDVWGQTPGGPSRLLSTYVQQSFHEAIPATYYGLRSMELLIGSSTPGVIRWIPPLLFQALCDFVGVVIKNETETQVAWGTCEADDSGYAPPPLFRVGSEEQGFTYLPIGLHVLRWCMMPLLEGEAVPPLADWVKEQYG